MAAISHFHFEVDDKIKYREYTEYLDKNIPADNIVIYILSSIIERMGYIKHTSIEFC